MFQLTNKAQIDNTTYSVTVQCFEEINGLLEEVRDFLFGRVACITRWLQRANAGPMFTPFMLPEALVVSVLIKPVLVHIRKQVSLARRLENSADPSIRPA